MWKFLVGVAAIDYLLSPKTDGKNITKIEQKEEKRKMAKKAEQQKQFKNAQMEYEKTVEGTIVLFLEYLPSVTFIIIAILCCITEITNEGVKVGLMALILTSLLACIGKLTRKI